MAAQMDNLNVILVDTISFFNNSLRPLYFEVINTIQAGGIITSTDLTAFVNRARESFNFNETIKARINLLRDEINRNANPDDLNSVAILDRILANGGNALRAILETCNGLITLANLSNFFNQSKRMYRNRKFQ